MHNLLPLYLYFIYIIFIFFSIPFHLVTCTCQRDHDDHVLRAALGQRFLQILEEQAVPLDLLAHHHLADPHVLQEERLASALPVHRVHVQSVIEGRVEATYLETRPRVSLLVYGRRLAHRALIALGRVQGRGVRGVSLDRIPRRPPNFEQKVLRRTAVRAWDAIHLEGGGLVVERAVGRRLRWLCGFIIYSLGNKFPEKFSLSPVKR